MNWVVDDSLLPQARDLTNGLAREERHAIFDGWYYAGESKRLR